MVNSLPDGKHGHFLDNRVVYSTNMEAAASRLKPQVIRAGVNVLRIVCDSAPGAAAVFLPRGEVLLQRNTGVLRNDQRLKAIRSPSPSANRSTQSVDGADAGVVQVWAAPHRHGVGWF